MDLGSRLCNFWRSPRVLLIFKDTIFRCSSNINLELSITPRCFWDNDWETLVLLNTNGGGYISFTLRLKMTSWACLVGSEIKFIFHWKTELFIIFKSLLRSFADAWVSCTTENEEVSSANSFTLVVRPSIRPLIWIKNNKEPRMEHWGNRALMFFHVEASRCFLSFQKTFKMFSKFLDIPFELVYRWYHHARPYQMLLIYQGKCL